MDTSYTRTKDWLVVYSDLSFMIARNPTFGWFVQTTMGQFGYTDLPETRDSRSYVVLLYYSSRGIHFRHKKLKIRVYFRFHVGRENNQLRTMIVFLWDIHHLIQFLCADFLGKASIILHNRVWIEQSRGKLWLIWENAYMYWSYL